MIFAFCRSRAFSRLQSHLRLCSTMAGASTGEKRVAALMIGNELLNGEVQDVNVKELAKFVTQRGAKLRAVEFIPDEYDVIADRAKYWSEHADLVVTSGGIGTTHDDITYEALARAFGLPLQLHQPTSDKIRAAVAERAKTGDAPAWNDALDRMATFPHPSRILVTPDTWVPTVVVNKNIYVLPGVPRLYRLMLSSLAEDVGSGSVFTSSLYTRAFESDIADVLASVQERFPHVAIGSYPNVHYVGVRNTPEDVHRVRLSFSGDSEDAVQRAVSAAAQAIPDAQETDVFV